ncbi:replication-associated recombination protein A [Mycoplasma iguanae]|uniref:Replication-associated recombination protein A n=1 Tax=Mycoplasma iguanae TaxID=292461 RepID=A0ABY5R953_9MOLU|nr:replication-associated recombination protein A [Mycoplasma iguanae]UVD81500.1 replication-associated recombination protein A [Mycoplasma iguanae]
MKSLSLDLRPHELDDLIGQHHLKELFQNIIKTKDLSSFIFYGKSGIGKTSAALILAKKLTDKFDTFNATIENKQQLLEKIKANKILIIDEIHRLNKDKQDLLLSYLENFKITIYATTTENPYFKINPAIRSRMHILEFHSLSENDMLISVQKILQTKINLEMDDATILDLVKLSVGDFRSVLNNLSLLSKIYNNKKVSKNELRKIIPNINFYSDKDGDAHYNNLSAFHKSLRGSDVNAALFYGALLIKSGDFDALFRRMTAMAYEDIGLANPSMGIKIEAAYTAFQRLGIPEGYLPIGHLIAELALSPKSNSTYKAFSKAISIVNTGHIYDIPKHLQDSHYKNAAKLGAGLGYKYSHNYHNSYVEQTYLPKELKNEIFFEFGDSSNEKKIKEFWNRIKQNK